MKNSKDGTSHVLLPALQSVCKPTPHRLVTLASGSLATMPGPLSKWRPGIGSLWVTTRQGSTQQHRKPTTAHWAALLTSISQPRPERARSSTWLPSSFQWDLLEHKETPFSPFTVTWPLSSRGYGRPAMAPARRSHEEEDRGSVVGDESAWRGSTWLFQFLAAVTRWEKEARALGMSRRERWGLLRHSVHDMRQQAEEEEHLSDWAWAEKADNGSVTEVKRLFSSFLNALPDAASITAEKETQLEMEKIALRFLDSIVWLSVLSSRNLNVPAFVIGMNIWHEVCVVYNLFITRFVQEVDETLAEEAEKKGDHKKSALSLLSLMSPATIGKRYAPNPAIKERWLNDVQRLHDNCVHTLALPVLESTEKETADEIRAMRDLRYALSLPSPRQRVGLPVRTRLDTARVERKTSKNRGAIAAVTQSWSDSLLRAAVVNMLQDKTQQLRKLTDGTEAHPRFLLLCEEVLKSCPHLEKDLELALGMVPQRQQQSSQETQSNFEVLLSLAIEHRAPSLVELATMSLLLEMRVRHTRSNSDSALVCPAAVSQLLEHAAEVLQDPSLGDWNCLLAELFADKVSSKFGGRAPQGQLVATFLCTVNATRPLYALMGKTASYDPVVLLKFAHALFHHSATTTTTQMSAAVSLRLVLHTVAVLLQDVLDKVPVRATAREYDQEVLRVLFGGLLPSCGAVLSRAPVSTPEEVATARECLRRCLDLVAQLGLRWDFMVAPERRQHRQAQRDRGNAQRRLHDGIRAFQKEQPQSQPHWSVHGDNDYPFFLSITPDRTAQLAQFVDALLSSMASEAMNRVDEWSASTLMPFMSAVHVVIREVDGTTGRRWEKQMVHIIRPLLTRGDVDVTVFLLVLRSLSSLRFGTALPVTLYTSLCRAVMGHSTDEPARREGPSWKILSSALTHTLRCIARNTNSSFSERVQELLRVVAMASAVGVDTTSVTTLEAMFQILFYRRHTRNGNTPNESLQTTAAHPSQPFTAHWWGSPVTWYRGLLSEEQWLPLLHDHFHVQRLVACALLAEGKVSEALSYIPSCDERVALAALRQGYFAGRPPGRPQGTAEALLLGRLAKLHVALYYCSMDRTASSAVAAKEVARGLLDTAPAELTQAWRATWRSWYQASQPAPQAAEARADGAQHIQIRPRGGQQFLNAVDRACEAEGELHFRFQPQSHLHTFEYDCCRQLASAAAAAGGTLVDNCFAEKRRRNAATAAHRAREEKVPVPAARAKIATEYLATISALEKRSTR